MFVYTQRFIEVCYILGFIYIEFTYKDLCIYKFVYIEVCVRVLCARRFYDIGFYLYHTFMFLSIGKIGLVSVYVFVFVNNI